MKKGFLFIIILFVSVTSIGQEKKQFVLKNEVYLKHYIGADYERIQVSDDDIRTVDSLVSKYLIENYNEYNWTDKIETYHEYYRQYAAYKNSSPERLVFINASRQFNNRLSGKLMEEILDDWKGGGSFHFKIKVNLETKQCFDLRVNAPK